LLQIEHFGLLIQRIENDAIERGIFADDFCPP